MAIKDSIVNLKKGLRTTLTNVPALIDTLVRGLDGVAEAAEEESTYSTDERVVGKWIDGKTIYEITVNIGELPNNTIKSINHGIANIDNIVYITGVAKSGNNFIPLPFVGDNKGVSLFISKVQIFVTTGTDLTTYSGTVTFRYTKISASRSPENDTKNNGDEEKNDEEVKNER